MHEEGFRVERSRGGELRFFDPRGERLPAVPSAAVAADSGAVTLAREHARLGLRITPPTGVSRWRGEPLHLGAAVAPLLERAGTARAGLLEAR